jgi:hypothetical protein
MPADLNAAADTLRNEPLLDRGPLLKPGGKAEVLAAIEKWKSRGLRAHVVITERNDDLAPWHGLWSLLSLDAKKDLLLVFNGTRWDARGWGLDAPRIQRALENAAPGLRSYYARGLVTALDELGAAATGSPTATSDAKGAQAEPRSGGGGSLGILAGLMLAIAGLFFGWMIRRRKVLGGQKYAAFEKARLVAEQSYADVMLAAEALPDSGVEEKRRASELKGRLDRLGREAASRPMSADDPVLLGKVEQLENEIAAIHSVILQRTKGN